MKIAADGFMPLFNMLFLMGYKPETSYEPRHSENRSFRMREYLDFLMEKCFCLTIVLLQTETLS